MSVWTGRDDTATEGPNALRWHQCVKPLTEGAEPGVVLIGFACDEGVRRNGGRVGAKDGPRALRKALANLAWQQRHPVYDAGDVACEDEDLEEGQEKLAETVAGAIRAGHRPLVVGGGHETAWGTAKGLFRARPGASIGVVNIDSHFDLRPDKTANSGTPFSQIAQLCQELDKPFRYLCLGVSNWANTAALYDRARDLGAEWVNAHDMVAGRVDDLPTTKDVKKSIVEGDAFGRLSRFAKCVDELYLSVDLDVLPASVMPAVSAPAGRGVSLEIVEWLVTHAVWGGNLVAADIVELNPALDPDGRGSRTAAYLTWLLVRWWAAESYGNERSPYARRQS